MTGVHSVGGRSATAASTDCRRGMLAAVTSGMCACASAAACERRGPGAAGRGRAAPSPRPARAGSCARCGAPRRGAVAAARRPGDVPPRPGPRACAPICRLDFAAPRTGSVTVSPSSEVGQVHLRLTSDHGPSMPRGTPVRARPGPRILSGHADPRRRPPVGGAQTDHPARRAHRLPDLPAARRRAGDPARVRGDPGRAHRAGRHRAPRSRRPPACGCRTRGPWSCRSCGPVSACWTGWCGCCRRPRSASSA